jgi:hypothetical protein
MKSLLIKLGSLLLPVFFLFSCAEEEKISSKKNHTFSFIPGENKEGQFIPVELPDAASLLISLAASSGEVILDQHQVALHKAGESYVSAPVELADGDYNIIDFMVVDDSLNVLYAIPRKGSLLSAKIAQSLPFNFMMGNSDGSDLRMEVLDARTKSSKSFGYNAFRQYKNSFKLQVFIPNGEQMQITSAQAIVMKELDTLQIYPLLAKMNTLTFNGTPDETYTLVIVKDSYSRYARNFTVNDPGLKGKPIKVILEPALSVVAVPIQDQNYFGMQFDAWGYFEYKVDWGDGSSQMWTSGFTTILDHHYPQPGKYFITITGHALDSALLVGDLFGAGNIEHLGMRHLANLREFRMEWASGPKTIDLSHNLFLTEVRTNETVVEDLIIPNNASIWLMELMGNTKLKNESLNEIINDIHHQVVNSVPHTGDFLFYVYENGNYIPITEPSPESWEKLRELKHNYGWVVVPDPDF